MNQDDDIISENEDEQFETKTPERRHTPRQKKQLDYKHETRITPASGSNRRKALKLIPHIERRKFRRALENVTQHSMGDEDAGLISADELKNIKQASFTIHNAHKTKPVKLEEAIKIKKQRRQERNRKPQV